MAANSCKPSGKRKAGDMESSTIEGSDNDSTPDFLSGLTICVVTAGIGKARSDIFKKQINKFQGCVSESVNDSVTHLVVDDSMDFERLTRILKLEPADTIKIVKSLWLSKCIREKKMMDCEEYLMKKKVAKQSCILSNAAPAKLEKLETTSDPKMMPSTSVVEPPAKVPKVGVMFRSYGKPQPADVENSDGDSDYVASGDEDKNSDNEGEHVSSSAAADFPPTRKLPKGSWVCAQASSSKKENPNKHITDKLEALSKIYESTNDRWRALGYQKAIAALKRMTKPVTSFEEAKAIQGIGSKLANKIWEIVESGELRKLDELSSNEDIKCMELFTNIWGAGAATARAWVAQGFRTLDDLRERGNLTRHQKIGLKYYDDLMDRMPHDEAGEIEQVVIAAAHAVNPTLIAMACGSYRRGKATCGDVDVLITHADGKSHRGIFGKILDKLKESGFLTDDLVHQEDNGNQKKYMGVCKLPGENRKHRRLDIIVVPYEEYACAVMYFTGSAHFNRSMRHLAGKMNMSLSEHSLNVGVVRNRGEKLNKGTPLPTPTEESVFHHLGLKYRSPEERDH